MKIEIKSRRFLLTLFIPFILILAPLHLAFAQAFDTQFKHLVNAALPNAAIGLIVQDATTGKMLYTSRAYEGFTPASTTKLFTAAAALAYLKPDYQFETRLDFDKTELENSILYAPLYITFTGDPTLTSPDLNRLFKRLRASGVHKLADNIVIDHSRFSLPHHAPGWSIDDIQKPYAAPISAIIIDGNKTSQTAISDLEALATRHIRASLSAQKINFKGDILFSKTPAYPVSKNRISIIHYSDDLAKIVKHTLIHSNNMGAEALLKTLGYYYYDKGTFENGVLATQAILAPLTGINFGKMRIHDGSGLSHYNCLTPTHLARLLFTVYHHDEIGNIFIDALPVSGKTGTLRGRLQAKGHQGQVSAKTGTLNGKSALAGYVQHKSDKTLIMVIMINQAIAPAADMKRLEDNIVNLILHHPEFS